MLNRFAEHSEQNDDRDHRRNHEGVRSEAEKAECRDGKTDDCGNMIFFFEPLLQKDHNEHRGHDEVDSGSVKGQQRADQSAESGSENPVNLI